MHAPSILNSPSYEACCAARDYNAVPGGDHKSPKGRVHMTARFEDEERELTLFVLEVSDLPLPNNAYRVAGVLEHPMINFKLTIFVNKQTKIGDIAECTSYPGSVNPWPFIPSNVVAPLSAEEKKTLLALSIPLKDCRFVSGDSQNTKLINALKTAGYEFFWHLAELHESELAHPHKCKGVGLWSYRVITAVLHEYGLNWGMDLTRFRDRLPKPQTSS